MRARLVLPLVFLALAAARCGRPPPPRDTPPALAVGEAAARPSSSRPLSQAPAHAGAAELDAPTDPAAHASPGGPAAPSFADEEALLRLLDEAKRENDPARRREALAGVCVRWAGFDPPGAIKLAADLKLDPSEGALVPNLAQQWAERDFPAARTWARRLPSGELRDEVYSRLVYECARHDPRAASALLAEMRPDTPAREEAKLTVVHFWAERDPKAAKAWINSLPRWTGD